MSELTEDSLDSSANLGDIKARRPHIMINVGGNTLGKTNFGEIKHHPSEEDYLYKDGKVSIEEYDSFKQDEVVGTQYEIRKGSKILSTIRRFRVVKQFQESNTRVFLVGDILEERFELPNTFVNISKLERVKGGLDNWGKSRWDFETGLYTINWENKRITMREYGGKIIENPRFESLELIDEIDTKDSIYFQKNSKLVASSYKSRMKKLATMNEELTNLRHLLDIKTETE